MELKETLKEEIISIVDLLYQQNVKEAYPRLIQMLPKLEQFIGGIVKDEQSAWLETLQSALEAMEKQDLTLLADILQYEIIERMDEE